VNDVANYLQVLNGLRHAQWAVRWSRQGGSKFWSARPLNDLRNDEDHRRYRVIDGKRRQLKRERSRKAKVINIAHERIERVRQKARINW
jgi:hypothetical protein